MLIMQEVLSEGRVILSSGLSAKAGRATSKHGEKKKNEKRSNWRRTDSICAPTLTVSSPKSYFTQKSLQTALTYKTPIWRRLTRVTSASKSKTSNKEKLRAEIDRNSCDWHTETNVILIYTLFKCTSTYAGGNLFQNSASFLQTAVSK